jgi:transcription antitermination factor NusG
VNRSEIALPPLGVAGMGPKAIPWYALHVRSNTEPIVEATLGFEGVTGFFPHQEIKRSRGGIWLKPYFPGYVFAQAELDNYRQHALLSIPQVIRIIGIGDEPLAIPDHEIATVRTVIDHAEIVQAAPARAYSEGDHVCVKCGPLKGCTGNVAFVKNATRIVVFTVGLLGSGVSTELDASWLCLSNPRSPKTAS